MSKNYGRTGKIDAVWNKILVLVVFLKILDLQEEDRSVRTEVSEKQGCENLFGRL